MPCPYFLCHEVEETLERFIADTLCIDYLSPNQSLTRKISEAPLVHERSSEVKQQDSNQGLQR